MEIFTLETPRIILRQWQAKDYAEFAAMNADTDVMRYFPSLLTRTESDALTDKFATLIAEKGWGFWVAELKQSQAFIGLVGLNEPTDLPIGNCIEVGWRLSKAYWGQGLATEAAAASLHFAFSVLHQERVAAFTAVQNIPSRKVMERLGMSNRDKNFLHPRVEEESDLKEHVFYEICREEFEKIDAADSVTINTH